MIFSDVINVIVYSTLAIIELSRFKRLSVISFQLVLDYTEAD